MGFSYFNNKYWSNFTREERYFCSHLYHYIDNNKREFLSWLNEKKVTGISSDDDVEISFEVCFYRDFYKEFKTQNELSKDLMKRTFDLVIFSEKEIILIEAKVQQPFKKKQLDDFRNDIYRMTNILVDNDVKITPALLCTKEYLDRHKRRKDRTDLSGFEKITWKELYERFDVEIFKTAESKYGK